MVKGIFDYPRYPFLWTDSSKIFISRLKKVMMSRKIYLLKREWYDSHCSAPILLMVTSTTQKVLNMIGRWQRRMRDSENRTVPLMQTIGWSIFANRLSCMSIINSGEKRKLFNEKRGGDRFDLSAKKKLKCTVSIEAEQAVVNRRINGVRF